jgi:putative membrane protein
VYYSLGVATLYVAGSSPIHEISENNLLSVHMFQHLLLSLVAPPLLLAGVPGWFWQWLFGGRVVNRVANVVLNPLVCLFVFNMVLVITHLPHVVDYALTNHWFHLFVHIMIVGSAMMMWWPVITNVPGLPSLTYPYRMAYLFVQSMLPSVIASFITFSTTAVYAHYEAAPRIWGLDPVADQQFGALIMKLAGSLILWGFIAVAFFKWYEMEQARDREPNWRDVEEELQDLGLSPRA